MQQWKDTVASDSSYNSESEDDVDDVSEDDTPPPKKQVGSKIINMPRPKLITPKSLSPPNKKVKVGALSSVVDLTQYQVCCTIFG